MTERILSAARERTEADVALRAELAAEASGRPPIATLSTPDGYASLRTCEGLTFAIGSVTRLEGGRVVREPGVRLVIPERTEENLRAVYGAMRAVVGPGVGGYEAWRETRLRERPVTARTAFGAATRAAVGEGERLSTRAFFERMSTVALVNLVAPAFQVAVKRFSFATGASAVSRARFFVS